ncbi:uncharacterized protein [Chlorocebus sabaeus]|uniref:uncharacterized protein isoform X1 n=1 Tax=Chlorocebus sabaeus TaxID=60711 RepID=UPI003BFA244E
MWRAGSEWLDTADQAPIPSSADSGASRPGSKVRRSASPAADQSHPCGLPSARVQDPERCPGGEDPQTRIRQQILEHKKKILKNGNPGCCPDEPESTHRFRAHMRRDPDLPPEGQLHTGFSYLQEWKWPSVTSWDLIRAAHSTSSAIQEYSTYSGISHLLRKYLSVEKGHAFFPAFAGLSFLLEMSGKRFSLEETPQEKQR